MAMSKQEMWNAATDRYIHIHKLYSNPDVSAESMFEELCCSVYGGDEWNETEHDNTMTARHECRAVMLFMLE